MWGHAIVEASPSGYILGKTNMIRSISLMVFPIALLGICNLCDHSKITVSSSFQMNTVKSRVLNSNDKFTIWNKNLVKNS